MNWPFIVSFLSEESNGKYLVLSKPWDAITWLSGQCIIECSFQIKTFQRWMIYPVYLYGRWSKHLYAVSDRFEYKQIIALSIKSNGMCTSKQRCECNAFLSHIRRVRGDIDREWNLVILNPWWLWRSRAITYFNDP